ncbi:PA14 domain-containing protein [Peribacillus sp. SCS-26]|uniref:PA14 domain-containing protein n=1 Tax=Paraperibacillus marinus TaxID=3115295 RepID=UPI003906C3B8
MISLGLFFALFFSGSNASAGGTSWNASYYPLPDRQGTPVKTTVDKLDFDWAYGSPNSKITGDNYSALFTKKITLSNSTKYLLSGKVDDGIRIWVDGKLQVNDWTDGVHFFNKEITLSAGTHVITVNYYEKKYRSSIKVDLQPVPEIPADKWLAAYYQTPDFSGTPLYQTTAAVQYNWGTGSPASSIPKDNFTAVYQKKVNTATPGTYKLSGTADDGIRIYVDNIKQVDLWKTGTNNAFSKELNLSAGPHIIRVEYFEKGYYSKIKVDFEKNAVPAAAPVPSTEYWTEAYYPAANFAGTPVHRTVKSLNYSWGSGRPAAGIPSDNFTAKYQKIIKPATAGKYLISGTADDGIRIYVDGVKQVDLWKTGTNNTFNKEVYLTAVPHTIKVEYFEKGYYAKLKVNVDRIETAPAVTADSWVETYYPSTAFTGLPKYRTVKNLNYSWGSAAPISGIPADNFTARYEKKINVPVKSEYVISGAADDGIRIYVDGVKQVDLWKTGTNNAFNKTITLAAGPHTVKVEYFEKGLYAKIKVDVKQKVPALSTAYWTEAYYPSTNFTGTPVYRTAANLDYSWSKAAPIASIPADNFTAVYQRSISVPAGGDYVISGTADDGIRIYVDNIKQVDLWKTGTNNAFNKKLALKTGPHTIRVEYFEKGLYAKIKVDVKKAPEVIRPPANFTEWTALYYPTTNLTGTPVETAHQSLNFNWGTASPAAGIPADNFSAKYSRKIAVPSVGKYKLSGTADDGVRIKVDGVIQVDMWTTGSHTINKDVTLSAGEHLVEVEYYEAGYKAALVLNIEKVSIKTTTTYTNYNYTLQSAVDKQVKVNPQTDKKYDAYVSAMAFSSISGTTAKVGTVSGGPWNVRGGAGTEYWVMAKLTDKQKITILSEKIKASDGGYWYKISLPVTWKTASPEDVKYYLTPGNFTGSASAKFQFLKLSGSAGTNAYEINDKILTSSAGVLKGKAATFQQASQTYNINEVYLISHALLETGNGGSQLAKGVKVKKQRNSNGQVINGSDGYPLLTILSSTATSYDAIVYNMYGIGALDSCALTCGTRKAFIEGWTTVDKAIIGGAKFVAENYVARGQDTLYKMRWNPAAPATHQYASDIGWAYKQTSGFYRLYDTLENYTAVYDIPLYQ